MRLRNYSHSDTNPMLMDRQDNDNGRVLLFQSKSDRACLFQTGMTEDPVASWGGWEGIILLQFGLLFYNFSIGHTGRSVTASKSVGVFGSDHKYK